MSRNKRGADQAYGRLRFKCPDSHAVGEAIMQEPCKHIMFKTGDSWIRIDLASIERTLHFTCSRCVELGRHRDLQASSPKVLDRLAELQRDKTRGTEDYVLGG